MKNEISDSVKKICDSLKGFTDYSSRELSELAKIFELRNRIAYLSNDRVANALVQTVNQISYTSLRPGREVMQEYLEEVVKDLSSGMEPTDVLSKYDKIYYKMWNG